MKNFEMNFFGVQELSGRELIGTTGGGPVDQLLYELAKLAIYFAYEFAPSIIEENCERPTNPSYQPYADLGHR
jgi:hypothetical protein